MVHSKASGHDSSREVDSGLTEELAASLPPDRVAVSRPDLHRVEFTLSSGMDPPPESVASLEERAPRNARSLGKYQFIANLGRGGMADVHLAVSMGPAGFSKLQVIKCLRAGISEEPEFRSMLLDEARLAARLNHRNIVQTNEVGLAEGQYFLAMEYLDGQPLSRIIARCRELAQPIPLAISLFILSEVLAGLHYAHELADYDGTPLGVVHRDISPHNIFVTYDGQVKIVDFGIALAARRAVETQSGTLKGKVAYMAPEQAFSPSSEIDRRVDVFSVGVILWELIAGRRLWRGLSDPQIISRLLRDIPDVRTARSDVPFELARICGKALAKSPADRYASAMELRVELERYAERLGEQVSPVQIGELAIGLFAEERAEIRAVIDRQLKSLQTAGGSGWDPTRSRSSLPALSGHEDESTPSSGSIKPLPRVSQPPGTLQAVVRSEESRARPFRPALVVGVGLAALSAAALLFLSRGPGAQAPAPPLEAPAPPALATAAAVPTALPAAPDRTFIRARLAASPPDAKILVDGSELPSNPFESKFVKDDAAHRIEVKAAGFIPQSRMVVFDKDLLLESTLQPLQGRSSPTATSTAAEADKLPPPKPDPY